MDYILYKIVAISKKDSTSLLDTPSSSKDEKFLYIVVYNWALAVVVFKFVIGLLGLI